MRKEDRKPCTCRLILHWRWTPATSKTYVCNGNKHATPLAQALSMPAKYTIKTA